MTASRRRIAPLGFLFLACCLFQPTRLLAGSSLFGATMEDETETESASTFTERREDVGQPGQDYWCVERAGGKDWSEFFESGTFAKKVFKTTNSTFGGNRIEHVDAWEYFIEELREAKTVIYRNEGDYADRIGGEAEYEGPVDRPGKGPRFHRLRAMRPWKNYGLLYFQRNNPRSIRLFQDMTALVIASLPPQARQVESKYLKRTVFSADRLRKTTEDAYGKVGTIEALTGVLLGAGKYVASRPKAWSDASVKANREWRQEQADEAARWSQMMLDWSTGEKPVPEALKKYQYDVERPRLKEALGE